MKGEKHICGSTYRIVRITTLVLAKALEGLGLIADVAGELNRLTADALATAAASFPGDAVTVAVRDSRADLVELAFGVGGLWADLLADLAFHPTFSGSLAFI